MSAAASSVLTCPSSDPLFFAHAFPTPNSTSRHRASSDAVSGVSSIDSQLSMARSSRQATR
jgi:hypothetical protein